jgi:SNF family Na+-dependent transporter
MVGLAIIPTVIVANQDSKGSPIVILILTHPFISFPLVFKRLPCWMTFLNVMHSLNLFGQYPMFENNSL